MIRLFVALVLPGAVCRWLSALAGGIPGARWVEEENLHLTLRFLGETEDGRVDDLVTALQRIDTPAFPLALHGVGQFGGDRKARALWAGVAASPALAHLQAKVESAVVRAGFPPETRKFLPHVTLARLKDAPPDRVGRFLAAHALLQPPPFTVDAFHLFESLPGRGGSVYLTLERFSLERRADED